MKYRLPIVLLFLCVSACDMDEKGAFNWIDGHRYRLLGELGVCAKDGSPVIWQRANSKNEFSETDARADLCK